ncbi:MAG: hypothetical protein HKO96_09225, partial [Flavobacteriaceae bacterium]|nr:hypothetical protein [Flavobacteriaceae bacterium]
MRITLKIDKQVKKGGLQSILFYLSHGKAGSPNQYRKHITSKVRIRLKHFDQINFRALPKHVDHAGINKAIRELIDMRDTALSNYNTANWSHEQAVNYLRGRTAYDNVDNYIETEMKRTRKPVTYQDYKNTLAAFKKHLNITGVVTWHEFTNYNNHETFKRNALKAGRTGTSVNSYFKKIRAIINDAHMRGYLHSKFTLNKQLRCPERPKRIETISPDDLMKAIDKIKTLRDWQSVAFYLLMFLTRGMYLADIVNFKWANLKNRVFDEDMSDAVIKRGITVDGDRMPLYEDEALGKVWLSLDKDKKKGHEWLSLSKYYEDGYDYLVHRRSKTKEQGNPDMLIRIDKHPTGNLIQTLQITVQYTHYKNMPLILNHSHNIDHLSIFNYDTDNNELHKKVWDNYQKRIKELLGYSYKTARKTFDTYAMELKVTSTVRRILLGH